MRRRPGHPAGAADLLQCFSSVILLIYCQLIFYIHEFFSLAPSFKTWKFASIYVPYTVSCGIKTSSKCYVCCHSGWSQDSFTPVSPLLPYISVRHLFYLNILLYYQSEQISLFNTNTVRTWSRTQNLRVYHQVEECGPTLTLFFCSCSVSCEVKSDLEVLKLFKATSYVQSGSSSLQSQEGTYFLTLSEAFIHQHQTLSDCAN